MQEIWSNSLNYDSGILYCCACTYFVLNVKLPYFSCDY